MFCADPTIHMDAYVIYKHTGYRDQQATSWTQQGFPCSRGSIFQGPRWSIEKLPRPEGSVLWRDICWESCPQVPKGNQLNCIHGAVTSMQHLERKHQHLVPVCGRSRRERVSNPCRCSERYCRAVYTDILSLCQLPQPLQQKKYLPEETLTSLC